MPVDAPLLDHPAETELFGDALTCEAVLPARFAAGERPLLQAQSEALLHGLAIAEDVRGEDHEDRNEATPSLQRLEAKLDLVLALLGRLARRQEDALPIRPLRWSHRGLRLDLAQPAGVAPGTAGVVMLQPVAWLSDHIELPATVLAHVPDAKGGQHLWLRFGALNPGLAEAMERHLFRQHRRQIAEARQAALASRED
ncbi:PilZ domain-containing protein [Pseudoxanthomonas putridarboris]|uniref:PilZ domain-containing protein n=1 Tax=Pseudoxanthomonas putridarboris TaxID=752605 RepID=A0ABU9IZ59_9GAMM